MEPQHYFLCISRRACIIFFKIHLFREMKLGHRNYHTTDNLRSAQNLVQVYQYLKIWNLHTNQVFCSIFVPFEIIFGNLAMYCNVTLELFWTELPVQSASFLITTSGFASLGFVIFLTLAGLLITKSNSVLKSWKLEQWSKLSEKKFLKEPSNPSVPFVSLRWDACILNH